jgi:glucosamine-6-phosphate deaminase
MRLSIHADAKTLGQTAGNEAGDLITATIRADGKARIVIATGASQFATLETLVARQDIDWSKVECFHLDEYIGLPDTHPASFRRYLKERFVAKVRNLGAFHGVGGDAADPAAECKRLGALIRTRPVDVLLLGIGENGHLAFNDPPADMVTREPYLVVNLDEGCRQQQLGEGWFPNLDAVPRQAISMSMNCILEATVLIASVPDARKAEAVRGSVEGALSPMMPGSYLRTHGDCRLHIDRAAAGRLQSHTIDGATRGTACAASSTCR